MALRPSLGAIMTWWSSLENKDTRNNGFVKYTIAQEDDLLFWSGLETALWQQIAVEVLEMKTLRIETIDLVISGNVARNKT